MTAPNRINVKYFIDNADDLDLPAFIPIFQRWIQEERISDHLMVDVADYKHVHHGPGIMLVGHEADYAVDMGGGRAGLMYTRKKEWNDEDSVAEVDLFQSRLRRAFRHSLVGVQALEAESSLGRSVNFNTNEVELTFADKLRTPNQPETFDAIRREVSAVADTVYAGQAVTVERMSEDPRRPLAVRIRTTDAPDVDTLLGRLV